MLKELHLLYFYFLSLFISITWLRFNFLSVLIEVTWHYHIMNFLLWHWKSPCAYTMLTSPLKVQFHPLPDNCPLYTVYPPYPTSSFLVTTNWSYSSKVYFCFMRFIWLFVFFIYHIWVKSDLIVFLYLAYCTEHNSFEAFVRLQMAEFHLFVNSWVVFHCVYLPHLLCPTNRF